MGNQDAFNLLCLGGIPNPWRRIPISSGHDRKWRCGSNWNSPRGDRDSRPNRCRWETVRKWGWIATGNSQNQPEIEIPTEQHDQPEIATITHTEAQPTTQPERETSQTEQAGTRNNMETSPAGHNPGQADTPQQPTEATPTVPKKMCSRGRVLWIGGSLLFLTTITGPKCCETGKHWVVFLELFMITVIAWNQTNSSLKKNVH